MLPWDEDEITPVLAGVVVLSLFVVLAIGLTTPATSEAHTEFYVLNESGSASGYPTNLSVNETGTVRVGLTNNERRQVTYTVVLRLDDERIESRTITVQSGESWQDEFSVTPHATGSKRLDILLYKDSSAGQNNDADQRLRLWIDVPNESVRMGSASRDSTQLRPKRSHRIIDT